MNGSQVVYQVAEPSTQVHCKFKAIKLHIELLDKLLALSEIRRNWLQLKIKLRSRVVMQLVMQLGLQCGVLTGAQATSQLQLVLHIRT